MLDTGGRKYVQSFLDRIALVMSKRNITPTKITIMALIVGVISAVLNALGYIILALVLLWTSGLLDVLDGTLARVTKKSTSIGTLMDIVFDRIVEILVVFSFVYKKPESYLVYMLLLASIILSMTVFLTVGALSENNGYKSFKYQTGIIERTEAFIFFSLAILFLDYSKYILGVLSLLIFITAIQRFIEGVRIFKTPK